MDRYFRFSRALFLKSVLISNFKRLNFPFKISFAVTYRCNLKCKMCNIWKKSNEDTELSVKEIDNFFKNANKFSWVGLGGGEAFLREDLPEIMDVLLYYCDRLYAVHFATNGQLRDKIVNLAKHIHEKNKKLKLVYSISIDGPPLLHDEIRGVKGSWGNAISTFKSLKDTGFAKPHFGFTLSEYNIDKFVDTFRSLKDVYPQLKFDDITVSIFQKSSLYYGNQDMTSLDDKKAHEEIKKILKMDQEYFSINNFLRRTYLKLYLKYIDMHKCPLKCQALSSTCFLDPYGNVFPCVIYDKKLLNIKDLKEDFVNVWNSDSAKKLSYECSNYKCPSCWSLCDAYSAMGGSIIETCLSDTCTQLS